MGLELHMKFTDPRMYRIMSPTHSNYNNITCIWHFGIFTGTRVFVPSLFSISPDVLGDIENRQGIKIRFTCEAGITIIFYWSVQIKLALDKPLSHCDAFPDNTEFNDLSILITTDH